MYAISHRCRSIAPGRCPDGMAGGDHEILPVVHRQPSGHSQSRRRGLLAGRTRPFCEEFRPVSERYRRLQRIAIALVALAASCFICYKLCPAFHSWPMIGFFICFLSATLLMSLLPVLSCPACRNALDQGGGIYCSECGASALQPSGWFRAPWCSSCGKTMLRRKGRLYKIRACRHCGVPLDEEGI